MSRADLDAQRALFIVDMERAGHAEDMDLGWIGATRCFADKGTRQAFIGWQAALAAQAPVGESDGAMYARVSRAVSPELSAAAQAEVDAALDRADAEDAQAPIKVELPQPYAGAVVLLETIAEYGAQAKFEDGSPTPNADLCRRFAAELRVVAQAPVQGEPVAWSVMTEGEHTGNIFITERVAQGCMRGLSVHYPNESRAVVPLYTAIDAARKAGES